MEPAEVQACDCSSAMQSPCGEDSNCLNRMLMVECHPGVCPAGERCGNQRFQKRQYPPIRPFRTAEGRGWGLQVTVIWVKFTKAGIYLDKCA